MRRSISATLVADPVLVDVDEVESLESDDEDSLVDVPDFATEMPELADESAMLELADESEKLYDWDETELTFMMCPWWSKRSLIGRLLW